MVNPDRDQSRHPDHDDHYESESELVPERKLTRANSKRFDPHTCQDRCSEIGEKESPPWHAEPRNARYRQVSKCIEYQVTPTGEPNRQSEEQQPTTNPFPVWMPRCSDHRENERHRPIENNVSQ